MEQVRDATFWDEMYRGRTAAWDSEPNPFLAEDIAGLQPGTALDVGCGEGSDSVWLAHQGWQVTAVDISQVALDRGRQAEGGDLVTWVQADVLAWEPPSAAYDLVSVHFLHFPPDERQGLFRRLARSVRAGGLLLIVAHHPSDLALNIRRPPLPDLFYTADEIAATLPAADWEILVADARPRPAKDQDGHPVTIHDTLLKARRR